MLIISCPCALALAAPAAYARAFAGLLNRGIVLRRAAALERLAKADAFLLDKTGTLSTPSVIAVSYTHLDVYKRQANIRTEQHRADFHASRDDVTDKHRYAAVENLPRK